MIEDLFTQPQPEPTRPQQSEPNKVSDENDANFEMDSDGVFEWSKDDVEFGQKCQIEAQIDFGSDSRCESDSCLSGYKSNDEDGPLGSDSEDKTPVTKIVKFVMHTSFYLVDYNDFRMILENDVIQEWFQFERIKNEDTRVTVVCGNNDACRQKIHVSCLSDGQTFKIKTYNEEHTYKL